MVSQKTLILELCSLFSNVLWALGSGDVFQMYRLGLGSTTLHFDWLWFSVMVCVAKRSPWWGVRTTLICPYESNYLECCWGLCCKVVIVGSLSRFMTSLALDSWLDFKYQAWLHIEWALSPIRELLVAPKVYILLLYLTAVVQSRYQCGS